ncbi:MULTISPECIES: DNA primase [Streptococcus]|uniref:DNA primase n=1 Tax=Streptococcus suis TaxID=1307 RepID=A0A116NK49_STRSU|nr:DNA primase [Streptococcus suis]MBM0195680.1 DNA primase [Streptococcus suis]MBM7317072.1 DNA primase [Streptococcus suis]NQG76273.1 DNA primase [Streptococcus suis]NQG79779.1 DNA primase [Streptococcus suis]CYV68278.1 DNA primase [Streptococcus suis]
MLSKDKITEIKQALNIVDVIGETVALTKAGRNYVGLCPFHGEKTPSFNVIEDKQFYHCFGCGKSGDIFKFVEEVRGVSFADAVAILAEKAGFQVDITPSYHQEEKRISPHQVLYDIHRDAAKFYHALLMTTKMGEEARAYLHQRGLTDDVIKTFQLGLAPAEQNILYQKLSGQYDEESLLNSGLFNPSENNIIYDAFQARIIFPLADEYGRIVAFSGRIWTEEDRNNKQLAKYKNSRSTAIFNKSYELYHLDKAKAVIKKQREAYLMEGFLDVIAAHRVGIDNAVASMGTALTREHVAHLAKFCKKIVLTYDGDKAGQAATMKALDELQDFQVEIVSLPDNMDPDEFLQKNSEEALQQVLTKSRISDVEFLIQYLKPENPDNLQMQIEFVDKIAPIIAKVSSITAQNSYIYKVADLLSDFDYNQVEQAVNAVRLNQRQERTQQVFQSQTGQSYLPPVQTIARITSLIRTENHLLYRMVEHPYILNEFRLREDFYFATPELQAIYDMLKKSGEITSFELSQLNDSAQQAWYRMQEERLPNEVSPHEIEELEIRRDKELLKKENQHLARKIREHSHVGNVDIALDELQKLLDRRRQME